MSNIVGNPFKSFVTKQVNARQEVLSGGENFRDDTFLKYVSKTPWLRMASSININDREKADKLGLPIGDEAARQFVLQGGSLGITKNVSVDGEKQEISYTSLGQKFGIATDNSIINQNSYGFGGSDWGKTPMPGLTSVTVEDFNRGAIRKAKVDFTCTNIQQFEIISTLYMRVGYNVLIEWGHSAYLNNQEPPQLEQRLDFNTKTFTSFFEGKNTQTILQNIRDEQKNTYGNYDAFMGRVTNFTWKYTNGAYECSIIVLTQGDVIESLKINQSLEGKNPPVKPEIISADDTSLVESQAREQAVARQDAVNVAGVSQTEIDAILADIQQQEKEAQEAQEVAEEEITPLIPSFVESRDKNIISTIIFNNYIKVTKNQEDNLGVEKNQDGFVEYLKFADGNLKEYFYISLGKLLKIIESNNLLYDSVTKTPIISIDTNYTTNRCARFPEQVSIDWSKCYIPYKVFNAERNEFTDNQIIEKALGPKSKRYDKQNYVGQLMCLLINADYINQSLIDNIDEAGRISLQDFLTDILQGIQSSIGGINDFQIGYDYTTNELKIYDNSPLVSSQMVGGNKSEVTRFQSYGVQKAQSASFLLDLDIQSSLPPNFANMLAAGSQTNGNQIGQNATAFSLWNQGLVDRVRPTNLDIQTVSEAELTTIRENESRLKQAFFNNKQKLYELLLNIANKESSTEDLRMAQDINVDFSNYYLGEATKDTIEDNGIPKSYGIAANFFIPFNMGLKMDGLSGMRLFDALSITNEVLPSLYTDSLVFIINGINHSITDAGWITSLSTQTFNQFNGTGDSPQLPTAEVTTRGEADLVDEFEGPTPNADFLRKYLKLYNIREKGKELSNGGDIDQFLAWGSIVMFDRIRQNSNLTEDNIEIVVTGGNDAYHQNITEYKSNHTIGKSLDFTVNGTITLPNGELRSARQLVKEWALQPLTKANKTFRFKDEYQNPVEKTTGGHFHIVYPTTGNEGLANQIKAENGTGPSYPIPFFSVYESFSYNGQTGPTYAEFLAEREANFNGAGTPSTNSTTEQQQTEEEKNNKRNLTPLQQVQQGGFFPQAIDD